MQKGGVGINDRSTFFYVALSVSILTNIGMSLLAYVQYNWYPNSSTGMMNIIILVAFFTSVILKLLKITIPKFILIVLSDLALLSLMYRLPNNEATFYESIAGVSFKGAFTLCITLLLIGLDWLNRLKVLKNTAK